MMLTRCISDVVTNRRAFSGQTLSAAAFVRRMRGGAQSSLLRASDGKLYVVKLQGNPQGPNVLANEALGSWLTARLGLKTPDWSRIAIDDAFLDQNQQMWFETPSGRERPRAGSTTHPVCRKRRALGRYTRFCREPGLPISRIAKTFSACFCWICGVGTQTTDKRASFRKRTSGD